MIRTELVIARISHGSEPLKIRPAKVLSGVNSYPSDNPGGIINAENMLCALACLDGISDIGKVREEKAYRSPITGEIVQIMQVVRHCC